METQPLYPNQALVEVATEVGFQGELAIEVHRHEFQHRIRDTYPRLLLPHVRPEVPPQLQHYRFERKDQKAGVQLAVNSFSFYVRDYPGADKFIDDATSLFGVLQELLPRLDITRVGWRYINAIPFAREDRTIPLSRYFNCGTYFGDALDHCQHLSLRVTKKVDAYQLNLGLGSARSAQVPEEEVLLLDIDAFRTEEQLRGISGDQAPKEIRALHDVARGVFEEVITDHYRDFLKGADYD